MAAGPKPRGQQRLGRGRVRIAVLLSLAHSEVSCE